MIASLNPHTLSTTRPGTRLALHGVRSPGLYLCEWNGHLLRMPRTAADDEPDLSFNIHAAGDRTVVKLSENPDLPLPTARHIAETYGLRTTF